MLPNFSVIWVTPVCGGWLFTIVITQRFLNIPDLVLEVFLRQLFCDICTYTHVCMFVRIHRYTCTKKSMYIYIYVHTHTHVWTVVFLGLKHGFCKSFGGICCLLVISIKYLLVSCVCPSDSLAQTQAEFCALPGNCAAVRFLSAFIFKKHKGIF